MGLKITVDYSSGTMVPLMLVLIQLLLVVLWMLLQ